MGMEQVLTVACKLQVPSEMKPQLDATLEAFANACTFVNDELPNNITNSTRMQTLLYRRIRDNYGLSANLTIRAIGRVSANRKTSRAKGETVHTFKPTSIDYDARIFSFREKDLTVSVTLLGGRQRFALSIGNYQLGLLKGQEPKSATLVKRKNGDFYIHIQVKRNVPEPPKGRKVIGIDLGRRDIAHTSEGDAFSGTQITQIRDKHSKTRASLQKQAAKGTRSSRRRCRQLQKQLSGKERRFQSQVNHTISIRLVRQAIDKEMSLALEDLTGIRERTNEQPRHRTERRRSNSWAFYQLRQYLVYKAIRYCVELVLVNPAYTSQTCHKCFYIGIRTDKKFACGYCGYIGDAYFNGACNIQKLGLIVTQPDGPSYACSLREHEQYRSGLLKAHAL